MNLSKKQEYLIIAGLLVLIFPFFALLFYVHPQGDDFFFAAKVNELGVLGFVKEMYFHWSGRYTAMFLGAFDPFRYSGIHAFRGVLLMFNMLNIIALYFFFNSIFIISKKRIVIITLFFYLIFTNSLLSMFEYSYWYPAVSAYQFGITLNLFYWGIIVAKLKDTISNTRYVIFGSILVFVTIGLSELFIFPIVSISLMIYLLERRKNKKSIGSLTVLIASLFSSFIMLMSPGNFNRLNALDGGVDIGKALVVAFKTVLLILGYFLQNPVFILSILLMVVLLFQQKRNIFSISLPSIKIKPGFFILFTIFILSVLILVPATMTLGHLPPNRVINLLSFYLIILIFIGIVLVVNYYKQNVNIPSFIIKSILIMMTISFFSGVFVVDKWRFSQGDTKSIFLSGNVLKAYYTLVFEAEDFDCIMTDRTKSFVAAAKKGKKVISIQPIKHHTLLTNFLYMNEFSINGEFTRSSQSYYYGLDSIYIKPVK